MPNGVDRYALGATGVGDCVRKQAALLLEGAAGRIRCPTLMIVCEGDLASQSDRLFAALTYEKTLVRLGAVTGAGRHCAGLGHLVWAGAAFPWMAKTLRWKE